MQLRLKEAENTFTFFFLSEVEIAQVKPVWAGESGGGHGRGGGWGSHKQLPLSFQKGENKTAVKSVV